VFRRKKQDDPGNDALSPEDQALEDAELEAELDAAEAAAAETPAEPERPQGPWDLEDAPDDELQRLDLGGLRIPVPDGTEVRVDVSPEGEVVAATLVHGESAMQVNAFAAPRRGGIWAEVREEIAEALRASGGRAEEAEGTYGTELRAQVPTEVPEQGVVLAPARFLGVDGPRWFLRALVTGPGAVDPAQAAGLEAVLRDVVVVRGSEAMAVRDPLTLHLPKEVVDAAATAADQEEVPVTLPLPERGPEITETR
jgi:hypothetical protein